MIPNNHFNLVSLGCPKNRVDSERILAAMISAGFPYTDDPASAGIIVINTCSFIESAVEESINTILDYAAEFKEAFLVVAGCLPMRYKKDLQQELPEVNLFLSADQIDNLPVILNKFTNRNKKARTDSQINYKIDEARQKRVLTTPGYAYLKISEGCSRKCKYCTIPSIRGPLKSASSVELLEEASFLVSRGVRELVLVAQDLTSYGFDRREKKALINLLKSLAAIPQLEWIRLMYLYPDNIPKELPTIINDNEKILPYLDIPFQHVSEKVLRDMGRPWKGNRIRKLVDKLRREIPGLVLRTTLMVGYPTEGESEFQELVDFVRSYEIDRVGVFTYSHEENTMASTLGDPVPVEVKQLRADVIREIHTKLTQKQNHKRIGSTEKCLVEGISSESELLLQGRLWDQAPEIDGIVYITSGKSKIGEICSVRITGAHEFDFFGEIVN